MDQGGAQSPADLYQQIIRFKNSADKSLAQARELDVPDDMAPAQQSLLIALELRRDGLKKVAEDVKTALGDEGEAADRAINSIAGQMQAFNASDVLYKTRVIPFIARRCRTRIGGHGHPGPAVAVHARHLLGLAASSSPPSSGSSSPAATATATATGDSEPDDRPGPARHRPGRDVLRPRDAPAGPRTGSPTSAGQAFTVSFTNQGDNDEFNIKVTVKIERESGGSPITLTKTVQQVAKGEKATVTLPLNREPPLDTIVNITTTVATVPGEKTKDNNTATYPSRVRRRASLSGRVGFSMTRPGSSRSPRRARR